MPPSQANLEASVALERYASGDADAVVRDLAVSSQSVAAFSRDFKAAAATWIAAGGASDQVRRRLIVATVALEAARALETRPGPSVLRNRELQWADRLALIEWACTLLRSSTPASPAERLWDLASIAFMEDANGPPLFAQHPASTLAHVAHATSRFPEEPRFALAAAVIQVMAAGLLSSPVADADTNADILAGYDIRIVDDAAHGHVDAELKPGTKGTYPTGQGFRASVRAGVRALAPLLPDPAVGAEAHLRLGAIELGLGQVPEALAHFEFAVRSAQEPSLVYLAHLFRGAALTRLDQAADAEEAYRAALDVVPHAQSASVALAVVLSLTGHRVDADAVIADSLSARPAPLDPFAVYGRGDARLWPVFMQQLRAALK